MPRDSVAATGEEFARISSKEHNVTLKNANNPFGPSNRFTNKGLPTGRVTSSGINRELKGKGAAGETWKPKKG